MTIHLQNELLANTADGYEDGDDDDDEIRRAKRLSMMDVEPGSSSSSSSSCCSTVTRVDTGGRLPSLAATGTVFGRPVREEAVVQSSSPPATGFWIGPPANEAAVAQSRREPEGRQGVTCSACLTNTPNVLFFDCTHLAMCGLCHSATAEDRKMVCPLCRRINSKVQQVFLP